MPPGSLPTSVARSPQVLDQLAPSGQTAGGRLGRISRAWDGKKLRPPACDTTSNSAVSAIATNFAPTFSNEPWRKLDPERASRQEFASSAIPRKTSAPPASREPTVIAVGTGVYKADELSRLRCRRLRGFLLRPGLINPQNPLQVFSMTYRQSLQRRSGQSQINSRAGGTLLSRSRCRRTTSASPRTRGPVKAVSGPSFS